MLMHIIIAPTWLRGRAKKRIVKNFINPEKMWQITCVMDVTQKGTFIFKCSSLDITVACIYIAPLSKALYNVCLSFTNQLTIWDTSTRPGRRIEPATLQPSMPVPNLGFEPATPFCNKFPNHGAKRGGGNFQPWNAAPQWCWPQTQWQPHHLLRPQPQQTITTQLSLISKMNRQSQPLWPKKRQ